MVLRAQTFQTCGILGLRCLQGWQPGRCGDAQFVLKGLFWQTWRMAWTQCSSAAMTACTGRRLRAT